jgi:uncharacterized NAD-dependent epimerase/dehydratase family protein
MRDHWPEGNAIVYCEGAFGTPNGKTAHGLVRRSERYQVLAIIDRATAGRDAGDVLDGRPNGLAVHADLESALAAAREAGTKPTHFVVGLAPDGGRLPATGREAVKEAIRAGLHVVSGLHDFLSEDPDLVALAAEHGVTLHDVRKPPPRSALHFFSGKIEEVKALKLAVLGTDSAVGKRTTAWLLVDALRERGRKAELIGTGQTAWLQGARYSIVVDSLVSDFMSGEIEHAAWTAWDEQHPDVVILEGQGSLLNPAYPGGYELLAAGRPEAIILQHAPARLEYDGFPGFPMHSLAHQIRALEIVSSRPVVAVTINHEGLDAEGVRAAAAAITAETGLPAFDVLRDGAGALAAIVDELLALRARGGS